MKTVNFIEAVNSGKRFRIKDTVKDNEYFNNFEDVYEYITSIAEYSTCIDLINAQFELEEKTVTITESQFDEAYDKANRGYAYGIRNDLKKELGF